MQPQMILPDGKPTIAIWHMSTSDVECVYYALSVNDKFRDELWQILERRYKETEAEAYELEKR